MLLNSLDALMPAAVGGVTLSPHNIGPGTAGFAVPLKTDATLQYDWTGSGDYYVVLNIFDEDGTPIRTWLYTGGVTPDATMSNIPKMTINKKHTFIWHQFIDITEL